MDELDLINLKKRARVAAAVGDKSQAIQLYQQALAHAPDDAETIMALTPLLDDADARRALLTRLLEKRPYHEEARAALAALEGEQAAPVSPQPQAAALHCHYHPHRETRLRCNKCGKPICTECAIRTPVGLRCPDCVRQVQDKFYTATTADSIKGVAAAFVGGLLAGGATFVLMLLLGGFGFFLFLIAFFVGPLLGGAVAEMTRRAMGGRRARGFALKGDIALVLGMLIIVVVTGVIFWAMFAAGLLLIMAVTTFHARMKF